MFLLYAPTGVVQFETSAGVTYTVSGSGTITVPLADLRDALVAGFTQSSAGGSSINPVIAVSASGSSQAIAFASSGDVTYDITLSANCAITLTGGKTGQNQSVTLILRQNATAGWSPTLPTGVVWPNGIPPTPNTGAGKIDVFKFSTPDAGVTVFGSYP